MGYVMAYAGPVPTDKKDLYADHAARMAAVFKGHGATRVVECWGDMVPPGQVTSWAMAVKLEDGESLAFGWQEWPDRASQEAGMQSAMQDPAMSDMGEVPIDGKRMIFAGFETLADL